MSRAGRPKARTPPNLLRGTLFTIVILLSEIPNTMIKKAAQRTTRRLSAG